MNHEIRTALDLILEGRDLSAEEMQAAMAVIMDGRAGEAQTAALLTALRIKGEAVAEIVGAARAMLERVTTIPTTRQGLLDTCGTGGDGLHTFNISTATAFVAAAVGVPVAKHGNRRVSSSSGSADVLEALGVNIELPPEQVGRCIDELGIGFCFARLLHTAMRHVAPVRQELGFRTIFNLLGPLTNPAGAEHQLLGANTLDAAEKLAFSSAELNRKKVIVVCGAGELDEV
ncbi:MAG: anthranilate phosphoribosyltransferase, partial [Planctomycetes bacterium]|nr:anthranilate phosphoribosyltransferase [Planctomycetota bacterium]